MSASPGDFWSRRRAQVAAEEVAEARAQEAEARAVQEAQLEERSDDDILAELDLPAPEEMQSTEQVQDLLKAAVPQRLKTRALRRLWRLNPVLANVDGLVDYGGDFTDAATVIENMQTVYQVGKGMFDKAVEAAEAEAAAVAKAEAKQVEIDDEAPDQVRGDDAPEAALTANVQGDPVPAPAPGPHQMTDDEDAPAAQTSRRMRFRFETAT
ncbi:DUF3306 domain-containing protein [Antarctobacter sp.]|uniref:DUF3306 domain-containing protein n=1 Tax=Antarctobacter sp. TaxID=1872577 RepID=UPI002B270580|nr:DUF3306 domain-containing protein [Antarctobacter sp.]